MEKVIFKNNLGLGVIINAIENFKNLFIDNSFMINGELLTPYRPTTLSGFFNDEIDFCGTLLDEPKCMLFHLGDETNLFDTQKYYKCLYYISENRVLDIFKVGTARDFIFKDGIWK